MNKVIIGLLLVTLTLFVYCSKSAGEEEPADDPADEQAEPIPYASLPQTQASFDVAGTADYVNVMGTAMPALPAFRSLGVKPARLRGYVKNIFGKPLAGAYIGVRSSAIGGAYTEASAVTDNNGYYEMSLPFGNTQFYAAGYALSYGDGVAAQGLYPADGNADPFVSEDGAVENFVLLSYGRGDLRAWTERPWYSRSYFGGTIRINYSIYENQWSEAGSLPANSTLVITLTPETFLTDATERKTFVINRQVSGGLNFNITNIPVGKYKITVKLADGRALKLKEVNFDPGSVHGFRPREALESSFVTFVPWASQARAGQAGLGGFTETSIKVSLP